MTSATAFQEVGNSIYHKLHLSTYPVAIKYIKTCDEIPDTAMQPSVAGKKLSLCQAFTMTRKMGATIAMTAQDNFCVPATAIHQWEAISKEDFIESQVRQEWHKDRAVQEKRFGMYENLLGKDHFSSPKTHIGFICAPLPETPFIPDSILVYCDGLQLTHMIHALTYEHKYMPTSSFEGYGESCFKGGLLPFLTGKPQVVIPGAGDRGFAGIPEHELGLGLPAKLAFYLMDNLFKSGGHMNLGYPGSVVLPMDLDENLTPGFQYLWDRMNDIK